MLHPRLSEIMDMTWRGDVLEFLLKQSDLELWVPKSRLGPLARSFRNWTWSTGELGGFRSLFAGG